MSDVEQRLRDWASIAEQRQREIERLRAALREIADAPRCDIAEGLARRAALLAAKP